VILVGESSVSGGERGEFLFHHLVAMFQTLALQQLGKLVNPISAKLERDLQQAKITIDMLQMIQEKTEGNLSESEKKLIDNVVMELQINYVDEQGREHEPEDAGQAAAAGGNERDETQDKEPGESTSAADRETHATKEPAGSGDDKVTEGGAGGSPGKPGSVKGKKKKGKSSGGENET
jgi:hypothetical protein